MAKYIINNNGPLIGEVSVSGAKNAVLPLMAASILSDKKSTIRGVPRLRDVDVMVKILRSLGGDIEFADKDTLTLDMLHVDSQEADYDLISQMRASFLIMGPLLGRKGYAKVYMPGGCAIGLRPIDLHLKGFEALGAKVTRRKDYVEAKVGEDGLHGATIYLDFPSVGATENIMMAAVMAKGTTYIQNVAEEPEIIDLANFLNKMGARIKGAGTDNIKIEGVSEMKSANHEVIPDRIEAGTFMLAAAITRGDVLVKNVLIDHLKPLVAKLRECGVTVEQIGDGIRVKADKGKLISTNIKTLPYPGFPTDLQSPFMAFLTTVPGKGLVTETVFENRFMHVEELKKMGAKISINGNKASLTGGSKLVGTSVRATDLRAGAAMVLAGLVAEGETEISDIYHIQRGYDALIDKLKILGADIKISE